MATDNNRDRGRIFALDRLIEYIARIADEAAAAVCAFLILATTASVIVYQQGITIVWLDDLLRALLIWLVYLGSVSLCFHNDHIAMDAFYLKMPSRLKRALNLTIALLGLVLCAYLSKIGFDSMMREFEYGTLLPSGYMAQWPQTLALPLCFALMALAYLSYLYTVARGRNRSKYGAPDSPEGP